MLDVLGNQLEAGDRVLFPSGAEQMKGTIIRIKEHNGNQDNFSRTRISYGEAFVENSTGNRKWKTTNALIKVNDLENN